MTEIVRITRVIINEGPNSYIVKCAHCKGTGQKYPGYGGTHSYREYKCPTCDGIGYRKMIIPDTWERQYAGLLLCAHCKGSGQKYPGYGDTHGDRQYQCPTCNGIGVLVRMFPRVQCSHCGGTGQKYPEYGPTHSYRQYQCPTCDGAGSVWIENIK